MQFGDPVLKVLVWPWQVMARLLPVDPPMHDRVHCVPATTSWPAMQLVPTYWPGDAGTRYVGIQHVLVHAPATRGSQYWDVAVPFDVVLDGHE